MIEIQIIHRKQPEMTKNCDVGKVGLSDPANAVLQSSTICVLQFT